MSPYHNHLFIPLWKVWSSKSRNGLFFYFLYPIHSECFRHLENLTFPWVLPVLFNLSLYSHRAPTGMAFSPHSLSKLSKLYAAFRVQFKDHHHAENFPNFNWKRFLFLSTIILFFFYILLYLSYSTWGHSYLVFVLSLLSPVTSVREKGSHNT